MNPQTSTSFENRRKKKLLVFVAAVPLLIISVVVGVIVVTAQIKAGAKADVAAQTKCLGKEFSQGSSGECVRDIQTMVNFMETNGLTECPFTEGTRLPMDDYFGPEVEHQVEVIQNWQTCYDQQEGLEPPDFAKGKVTVPTWNELCTYAYFYPSQNSTTKSPYRSQSLAAGRDAGCDHISGR